MDDLEPFDANSFVKRLLGMGDLLSLSKLDIKQVSMH